jgi:hypothetical protein
MRSCVVSEPSAARNGTNDRENAINNTPSPEERSSGVQVHHQRLSLTVPLLRPDVCTHYFHIFVILKHNITSVVVSTEA